MRRSDKFNLDRTYARNNRANSRSREKLPIVVLVAGLLAFIAACAPSAPQGSVDVGAAAVFAAQTRDAAGNSANVFQVLAAQTALAATATRQGTLDAQNDALTRTANEVAIANATATATRVFATEEAQRAHETGTATRLIGEQMARVAETAQKRQEQHSGLTATWIAASPTRAFQLALAAETVQAHANELAIANAEAKAKQDTAWLRELGLSSIPLVIALILFCAAFLGAFILLRLWMVHEQNMRLVERGEHVIAIESGNPWGGAARYNVIDVPPAVPALPAATLSTDNPSANRSAPLTAKRLNLAEQPHGLALPIGVTAHGDKWLPLARAGHILVGGPTGSGKTYMVHAFIQSLLYRSMAELVIFDGKQGLEFARYAPETNVQVVSADELDLTLAKVLGDMANRFDRMLARGVRDIERYNVVSDELLPRKVVIIDELKFISSGALSQILSLMRMGRAAGIHVILATQFPDAKSVPIDVRGNATTRIAFAVANHYESMAILGSSGAEDLPSVPGRILLECFGERIEAQTFLVDLPDVPIVTAPPSPFSDLEKKMIQIALDDDGWFKVRKIARALGIDDSVVTATAEAWERRGWLSKEKANVGRPGKNGRALLPTLLELAKQQGMSKSPHVAHIHQVRQVAISTKSAAI